MTKIINLSTYTLTKSEIKLLKLGLKFCPASKSNITDLKKKKKKYLENLKTFDKNENLTDESLVKINPISSQTKIKIFLKNSTYKKKKNIT